MGKNYRNYSKVATTPRRPFEKERLDRELKIAGEYGLKNKHEIWRVGLVLTKIRNRARDLLTLPETDPKRMLEGRAILRRCTRLGLLDATKQRLDYCLSLTIKDFMERRLQTLVFKQGLAKSIHHARTLIAQRHISVGKQMVNAASFLVRVQSEKHIDFHYKSPFATGKTGAARRAAKAAAAKSSNADDE